MEKMRFNHNDSKTLKKKNRPGPAYDRRFESPTTLMNLDSDALTSGLKLRLQLRTRRSNNGFEYNEQKKEASKSRSSSKLAS